MTFNIRHTQLPFNSVVLDSSSGAIPSGFTHYSVLFNKYPKGIPDLCTQPGGSIGSDSHSEISIGPSHDHDGSPSHFHNVGSDSPGGGGFTEGSGITVTSPSHKHTTVLNGTSPSVTVCAATFGHTHDSQSLEPENQTVKYIQESLHNIRSTVLPPCKIIWYSKNVSTVPSNFSIDSSLSNNRFYKGVPDACTSPGTQSGTNAHQHSSDSSAHTHSFCLPGHTHSKPSQSGGQSAGGSSGAGAGPRSTSHTHSTSPMTVTAAGATSGTTTSDAAHQHSCLTHLPLNRELLPIKTSTVSLRVKTLPVGSIVLWACNLSLIPTGWQVADGTNGTVDTLDRHARSVPNVCTNPGSGSGASSHQHSAETHIHTNAFPHTHVTGGTLAANTVTVNVDACNEPKSTGLHTHSLDTVSGGIQGNTISSGSHQHASTNNDPSTIRVAYIERI